MEKGSSLRLRPGRRGKNRMKRGGMFLLFSSIFLFSPVLAFWFGQDSCPSQWSVNTGYADAQRFQAPEAGTSSRLEILTYGELSGGTVRMAVYDDSIGHPNHKLWEGSDIVYISSTWCGEDVNTIQINKNSYYWFAFKISTTREVCFATGPTDSHEWKAGQLYANPFPDPWGSYTGHNYNRYSLRMHYTTSQGNKGIIEIDPGIIEGGIIK